MSDPGSAGGVLLAAGQGKRFGGPKALARVGGQQLVERGVATLRDGGCNPVVVVLGAEAAQVRSRATLDGTVIVENAEWRSGMASSLRAGLDALEGQASAAVVALVDQPLVGPEVVARLIAAWRAGAEVAAAAYGGVPRNPVLFAVSVWDELRASLAGDSGARGWLRANPERVEMVDCSALGSAQDIDTPDDLAAVTRAVEEKRWS